MLKKLFLIVIGSLVITSCSVTNHKKGTPIEQWDTFNPQKASIKVPQNRVGVIFLRDQAKFSEPAANIFVNGHYLTSLLDGGYKVAYLCSFKQRISSSFTAKNDNYREKDRGDYYTFRPNSVIYIKVGTRFNKPDLTTIPKAEGDRLLAKMQQQNHTLSRVDEINACPDVVIKQFNLTADALFKFDKSDYANMLAQGRRDIAEISKEIHKYDNKINRISIIGYTDPEGNDQYNLDLSQKRADTVKQVLLGTGSVYSRKVFSEGRGEEDLLVPDCRVRYPKNPAAREVCDQPNRRVEILLYGAKEETNLAQ